MSRRAALLFVVLFLAVGWGLLAWLPPGAAPAQSFSQIAGDVESLAVTAHKATLDDKIGLTKAAHLYGRLPTGEGIVAGHVEGKPGKYVPKPSGFGVVRFIENTGPSKPFAHTDVTARLIYGPHGLAPGIRVVHNFDSIGWLGKAYLNTATAKPPDPDSPIRLFNDSWIGTRAPDELEILHRVDYQIDAKKVVMCVAVNNGKKSSIPPLLASAYNVIAVGEASGNSSGGYTRIDTPGRCKPDIVAPKPATSFATPVVTGCAARLMQAADTIVAHAKSSAEHTSVCVSTSSDNPCPARHAADPQVIKAVLMAGAVKPARWHHAPGKPLDDHLGAGEVNFFNSYTILLHGPQPPGKLTKRFGWDYHVLSPGQDATYTFRSSEPLGHITLMLVWDRRILGGTAPDPFTGQPLWLDLPTLAHFDLHLERLKKDGSLEHVAASSSAIDNVQLIYLKKLPAGRYRIQVMRTHDDLPPWSYALAWRIDNPKAQ